MSLQAALLVTAAMSVVLGLCGITVWLVAPGPIPYLGNDPDPPAWCPGCDHLVATHAMVWADLDLWVCHECAGVDEPFHSILTMTTVR